MIFPVVSVPPLGFTTVLVTLSNRSEEVRKLVHRQQEGQAGLQVSPTVSVDMFYYQGSAFSGQPSGAYVFRPDRSGKHSLTDSPVYSQITGPLVNESVVELSDWGVLTSRTYTDRQETEVTWQVGPITGGREVVLLYTTDINNSGVFYTDANGRQMMRRVVREDTVEREGGNYYPVTSRLELRGGEGGTVSLVTDRSQGGASLNTGQMELMVHRRCTQDDWFGVGEALEEEAYGKGLVARGQHFLLSGSSLSSARLMMQEKVLSPRLSLLGADLSLEEWISAEVRPYSALSSNLRGPASESVQILTLSKWKNKNEVLLRFQHIFSKVRRNRGMKY